MDVIPLRASSVADLLDCPARWKAKYIDGKTMPTSGSAYLGTAIHFGAQVFDAGNLPGGTQVTPDDAVGVFLDTLAKPDEEVVWSSADLPQKTAQQVGSVLLTKYCLDVAPTFSYDKVELKMDDLDVDCGDFTLRLTGKVDRVHSEIAEGGKLLHGIVDLKTGKRAVDANGVADTAKHGAQLAQYELLNLAAERLLGEPMLADAKVIAMKTSGNLDVVVTPVKAPYKVLLGDAEHKGILDHVVNIIQHEIWWGNPRSQLCGEKYCPVYKTCRWRFTE